MAQTPWQDLIPFYVARTLPPAQMQAFEAQLAHDPALRREVDEWRRIAEAVWREADTAARHLPPLAPEVYQKLQYRSGAQPVNPTGMPLPGARPSVAQRVNNSPLMFVAGFLIVFLFGGLLLFTAARQLQPQAITTAVAASTDNGFGHISDPGTTTPGATACVTLPGTSVPGCVTATSTPMPMTWTPRPAATSTAVVVRPLPTRTPSSAQISPSSTRAFAATPQPTLSFSATQPSFVASATPIPADQCIATNTSGDQPIYAYASYTANVVGTWPAGSTASVYTQAGSDWIQIRYGQWLPIVGLALDGPACVSLPQPSPTLVTDDVLCMVMNTGLTAVNVYAQASTQSAVVAVYRTGDRAPVTANTQTVWYQIFYNGQSGWLNGNETSLALTGNCGTLVEPSPTYTAVPLPTEIPLQTIYNPAWTAVTKTQAFFYTLPDTGSPVFQTASAGTAWSALGTVTLDNVQWVAIASSFGPRVWVDASQVDLVNPAVPTVTPTLMPPTATP